MNTEFFRKKYHFAVEFMAAMHYNKRSIPKWGRWYAVLNIVLVEPEIPQNCGNCPDLRCHRQPSAPDSPPWL